MPATKATTIILSNQVMGGISDTRYLGIENSVAKLRGFNIHGEPGVMKINQKLTKISGTTINEFCKFGIVCSNGERYLFSSESGKVWRVKADFTVSLCYTTVAESGESKCLGAIEYFDHITWFTENRVHRISTTAALTATWSAVDLNWKDFSVGDDTYHPSVIQNDVLYIGDGYEVAALENETWTPVGALNVQVSTGKHRISAMMNYLTSILFGTNTGSDVVQSVLALWNTWSTHITGKDELPEQGVNCFLKMDNYAIASAGRKGNFYTFNGSIAEQFKRLPGEWEEENEAIVYDGSNANRFGMPLFGISNGNNNPCEQGVYSFGSYSSGYRKVINHEWVISTGNVTNVEIGAILLAGYDMLVAWRDSSDPEHIICGVDKLDTSAKYADARMDSRIIKIAPDQEKLFSVEVFYRDLPGNSDVKMKVNINNAGWGDEITLFNDEKHNRLRTELKIKASTIEFSFLPVVDGNYGPEIELIRISFN